MVHCPYCLRDSTDAQFCDHCNAQLPTQGGALPASILLPDGQVVDLSSFKEWPIDCARPIEIPHESRPLRVYALSRSWWRDLRAAVERRAAIALPILAPIHIVPAGDGVIVVAESLPGSSTAMPADTGDELERVQRTVQALRKLVDVMITLHDNGFVWLNFDPREIVTDATGRTQLTNLDLLVYPIGVCPDAMRLSPAFSPMEVCGFQGEKFGRATDVYHLGMYAYYRLAGLLPDGFAGQGLESFEFELPPLRVYRPSLPPGLASVIARATARDPEMRFARPSEFLEAMEEACDRLLSRPAQKLAWSCGCASAIGRVHEVAKVPNQDACTMLSLDAERALFLVADGVSTCSVGSGELASQIATDVLAAELPELLRQASTPLEIETALATGCVRASEAILGRALQENPPPDLDPAELMSTTVLIGYLHGSIMTIASVGDSRGFLVRPHEAEQLTVDGDVRCVHLAHGTPPEHVRNLGLDAMALFACLGVGEMGPTGKLVSSPIRTRPQINHWPLSPGDVIVLASDGLVEEGVFLDPADLAKLCFRSEGPNDAVELAKYLVASARILHRSPSMWEPFGCGDDVTVIVIRA